MTTSKKRPPSRAELERIEFAMAPSQYAIRSMLDGLDEVAHRMERKWGIGRLRLEVSDLMRAKFDSQADLLDEAIRSGLEVEVKKHSEAMKRAWIALDRAATEAGVHPLAVDQWEFALPGTGEVCVLVRDAGDVARIRPDGRLVWSLDEIAAILGGMPDTLIEVKRTWTRARVAEVREKTATDWEKGDPIPF